MGRKSRAIAKEAKREICCYGFLSFIFYGVAVAASILVLSFSFVTVKDVTENGNLTILHGPTEGFKDPCDSDKGLSSHHPVRFSFGDGEPAYMCTWNTLNNGLRIALGFIAFAVIILDFIFTFIRRSRWMYILGFLLLGLAVGFFYLGIEDSKDVNHSNSWCGDGGLAKDVAWYKGNHSAPPAAIKCSYTPMILVCFFDFLTAVIFAVLSYFAVCFVCKAGPGEGKLKKGGLIPRDETEREEPSDKFGPPEESPVPDSGAEKKKKKKSGFNFFSRNKGQQIPDEDPDEEAGRDVNFEKESASRFAPMSKTDREAKDLPLGRNNSGANNQTVGNALFNFDDMDSSQGQKPSQPAAPQQAPEPVKQQPAPKPAQPANTGGVVDFEALSGNGNDTFF